MKQILLRAMLALVAAAAATYAGDAIVLHFRMAGNPPGTGAAYGTVTYFYSADLKNHKFEIFSGQPQQETCVRAIFPHHGYPPCWYSRRRTIRTVE